MWSESRKELEVAIQAEKARDHSDWNPDLQVKPPCISYSTLLLNQRRAQPAAHDVGHIESPSCHSCSQGEGKSAVVLAMPVVVAA